jgi:aspartate kinase
MAGETDRLVSFCREASPLADPREYDVVVAAGEQVTAGLLAIALQAAGMKARSWLGWQLPVHSSDAHGTARIEGIETEALTAAMARGEVAVVPGFQGLSDDNRITTLGRGGSDTSAVALAAALKADRCDIYTDVDGVYTTDPRIVPRARKLARITYEEMLELASVGAKVLQTRSVELAMRYKVRLRVLSSFEDTDETSGTLVCDEDEIMESKVVSGVAHSRDEAKMTLVKVEDRPGIAAAIFGPLADAGVNVDMIVQNISEQDNPADKRAYTDMTFSCPTNQTLRAQKAIEDAAQAGQFAYARLVVDTDVAKVSVVGIGMRSHAGVAAKMFSALAAENVNIKVIATSEIKISVLIDRKYMELAVQALHDTFDLDKAV